MKSGQGLNDLMNNLVGLTNIQNIYFILNEVIQIHVKIGHGQYYFCVEFNLRFLNVLILICNLIYKI